MIASRYIAADKRENLIVGLGFTGWGASVNAETESQFSRAGLVVRPCTEALATLVEEQGGECYWDERNGVACTFEEAEAHDRAA